MKQKSTPLVDGHLQSLHEMKDAVTDEFFYTRLKARMEREASKQGWNFPLKPVWVVGSLALLLAANVFMLSQQYTTRETTTTATSSLQSFAQSYDQAIASSY